MPAALLLFCLAASALAADQPTLAGRVLSAKTGQPLRRARVTLSKVPASEPPHRADTDRDGNFVFPRLDPGAYTLAAECQGYAPQVYGENKPGGHGAVLTLAAGQQPPAIVFRLLPHAVISGRILDEDGDPLAEAYVSVFRTTKARNDAARAGGGDTNDLGQYRIWGLAPGRYYLKASLDRSWENVNPRRKGAPDTPQFAFLPAYYPGVADPAAAAPIDLTAGAEARGIDLRLLKTRVFRVRGRFLNAAKPVAHGTIFLWLRDGGPPGIQAPVSNICDQDGAFEFVRVPSGAYTLQGQAGESEQVATLDADVAGEDVSGLVLNIEPGIEIAGAARLEREPGLKWHGFVSLSTPDSPFRFSGNAEIRPDGTFTLKNVPPGRRTVSADAGPGLYLKSARFGREEVVDSAFEIPPTAAPPLLLVFARADAELSGVVRNQAGEPVAGALVYSLDSKRPRWYPLPPAAVADSSGQYTLKQLAPGDLRLLALEPNETAVLEPEDAKALQPRAAAARLAAGARVTLDLKLLRLEETPE